MRDGVRSGEHRRRGGVTAACLAPRLSWLGELEAAPARFEGGGERWFVQDRLSLREKRQRLECSWTVLKLRRVGVWRCVVLCCGGERQKTSFGYGVLGLIGADDLCQG